MPLWIPSPRRITTFYLLALASAQQQHSQDALLKNSPPENRALRPITANTKSSSNNERADATFAPAALAAVRASNTVNSAAVQPSTRSGLSSARGARSLQDWEVENFVLLATVDGSLYARDRNTGQKLWKFTTEDSLVETIYHRKSAGQASSDPSDDEDQWMWIVEPNQDGSLYVFVPGPGAGIQKLGPTVKELADQLSPWVSEDSPYVYTAMKKTTLITLNATNGEALRFFSAGNTGVVDSRSCRSVQALEMEEDNECEPTPTINIGRVEYLVSIQDKDTGEDICTIKYFEWTPNNRDKDLQLQYASTMDNKYIYTRFDGGILAFQHAALDQKKSQFDNRFLYRNKFETPVVRVFDVARPQGTDARDIPLVLLPQPVAPADDNPDTRNVFVNCTESGSWYALSELSYPTVTDGASEAKCYASTVSDDLSHFPGVSFPLSRLVGVHSLSDRPRYEQDLPAIAAPLEHVPESQPDTPRQSRVNTGSQGPFLIEPPPTSPSTTNSWYKSSIVQLLVILILSWSFIRTGLFDKALKFGNNKASFLAEPIQDKTTLDQEPLVSVQDHASVVITEEKTPPSLEEQTSPIEDSAPRPKVTFAEPEIKEEETRSIRESSIDSILSQVSSSNPNDSTTGMQADGAHSDSPVKKKKKTHRGLRSGRKKKLAEQKANERKLEVVNEGESTENIEQVANSVSTNGAVMLPDNSKTTVDGPITEVEGRIHLGKLAVFTDKILGYGSGGTIVYEGKFGGRDVAVKRMLRQHFELASQEIEILGQSDHHKNIIRYYDDQKDLNFLYIAVELCRTNLYDLYQEGSFRDGLTEDQIKCVHDINLNSVGALKQLAEGVAHLHSLRIIHRDIKPQNILIAYPYKNEKNIRLVISDFGLCRSLPENASTLIGTVANAGTVGWKAPELIGQPKENDGRNSSTGGDLGSSLSNEGNSAGVKRAVDIFSLGCVFYYVLTNGAHPFDNGKAEVWQFEREYRIKNGEPSFEALKLLGSDAEEPMDLIEWMISYRPEER